MRLTLSTLCMLALLLPIKVLAADAMCDVARNPAAYDGRIIVVHGDMSVGMHGSGLFNPDCYETPMAIRLESGSEAEKKFHDLYAASLYADRELRRVEAKGTLHVEGDRYYLDVTSVDRPKKGDARKSPASGTK